MTRRQAHVDMKDMLHPGAPCRPAGFRGKVSDGGNWQCCLKKVFMMKAGRLHFTTRLCLD